MNWTNTISCGHMVSDKSIIPEFNYSVECVEDEYDMNDSHIYKTSARCYVSKREPSKLPDIGNIMAYVYIPFKADDGYGPSEIHHVKVLEHMSNNELRVMPLDKTDVKCEEIISFESNSFYTPIYEE